ncbi:unnamed protein product [Protopolystoma xenopodis]|uniref:Uncharacterized protein n=1 Tax=Protopolystoma xenopodis TaxID=117903 RepID=A0A3S5CBS6_9PLAT|nr:unnamed protein product [Protopolystoma xenopodis]
MLNSLYESRLATFDSWVYDGSANCTREKLAKAGFYWIPSKEKDCVRCFMCSKELDGWEPDDDPMAEHRSHSSECPFLSMKPFEDMTVEEAIHAYLIWFKYLLSSKEQTYISNFTLALDSYIDEYKTRLYSLWESASCDGSPNRKKRKKGAAQSKKANTDKPESPIRRTTRARTKR